MEGMFFVDAPTLHALVTERFNLLERPMSSLPLGALHRTISEQNGVATCRMEPTLGGALQGAGHPATALGAGLDARYGPVFGRNGRRSWPSPNATPPMYQSCTPPPWNAATVDPPLAGKMDTALLGPTHRPN